MSKIDEISSAPATSSIKVPTFSDNTSVTSTEVKLSSIKDEIEELREVAKKFKVNSSTNYSSFTSIRN